MADSRVPRDPLISIVVPVYNEAATVAAVIDRLLTIDLPAPREIVVVNDGSRDATRQVLDALSGSPLVTVIHSEVNHGKGHAIRLGLARARGTVIAIQDADLELDPAQLAALVTPILAGEAAVVYGSRFLAGRPDAPWLTIAANRGLTAFTNLVHGSSITDMETCYKIMRADVAHGLELTANRFDIEPEITARLLRAGHRIQELPVTFTPRSRAAGKKIGWRDGVKALGVLWALRPAGRSILWTALERYAAALAVVVALAAVAIGWSAGTHAAGGSDSYCYLNQAELIARGVAKEAQPLSAAAPWPNPHWAFVPAGHAPVDSPRGAIVPICPAGYPLLMVPARAIAGRPGMLAVVPLLGGLAVWLTFLLGRRGGGGPAGLLAALMLAVSPIFIYQVVQPMNDVPAAAFWALALLLAWRASDTGGTIAPALAGLAAGAALTVRPNLLPLALAAGFGMVLLRPATAIERFKALVAFGVGALPGVATIMAVQTAMYGSPMRSGYGDLGVLFSTANVLPNLARYPKWLLEAQTPIVLLALGAPFVLRRRGLSRHAWWLLAFVAATFACYIPYIVFDAWWFSRFLLPGLAPLLVLSASVLCAGITRLKPGWRTPVFAVLAAALAIACLSYAERGQAFDLQHLEARYREAGEYVATRLPTNAVVLTKQQSGSVRFYSGFPTVVWSELSPGRLPQVLEYVRARGYRPYLLFEVPEENEFRKHFAGQGAIGALNWPPIADINHEVRIYDPDDAQKYYQGVPVYTDRVWTRRRR